MTPKVKSLLPEEMPKEARVMVDTGFASGKSVIQIQRLLKGKLGEKISQKIISGLKETRRKRVSKNLLFKKTGSKLVKEFLEKAKEGEDVSHLQSVLEHAVYIDCLNRYSIDTEAFNDWSLKDVIKVANDYKKMRTKGEQGEKLSGALAAKLFELVKTVFLRNTELRKVFDQKEQTFLQKLESLIADDSLKSEFEDLEMMQTLYEKHAKEAGGGSGA